ncbi:hypothetical protein Tco_0587491 [Tanacetum coccineum]
MLFTMRETYVDRNPKELPSAGNYDRQLPFEFTIHLPDLLTVVVMAQPVQNINHSAFRSMFEREKLSGNNFNDWFRQLKLFLRVEKKMYVIEQPLPAAPTADSQAQDLSENFELEVWSFMDAEKQGFPFYFPKQCHFLRNSSSDQYDIDAWNGYLRKGRKIKPKRQNRTRNGKAWKKTKSSPSPSLKKSTQVNPDKPEAKSQEKQV